MSADLNRLEFDRDWARNYLEGIATVELEYDLDRLKKHFTPAQADAIYRLILSQANHAMAAKKMQEAHVTYELAAYNERRPWWKKLFRK